MKMTETMRNDPEKFPPVRRVGSVTLGICLIMTGVLFLLYYFVPGLDWMLALKIAPSAGLILLGLEVLYFAHKPERWKYDFMSVFLCLLLMGCCFCLASLPILFREVERPSGPEPFQRDPAIERELDRAESRELDEENELDPDVKRPNSGNNS